MYYRLKISEVSSPGKLWTGSNLFGLDSAFALPKLIQTSCGCGATTKRLWLDGVIPSNHIDTNRTGDWSEWPVLFVSTGGVGSCTAPDQPAGKSSSELVTWNWSGRGSGWVIIDPLLVISGKLEDPRQLPVKGNWIKTYSGDVWSEYVLLGKDMSKHIFPVDNRSGICPICRAKKEEDKILQVQEKVALEEVKNIEGVNFLPLWEKLKQSNLPIVHKLAMGKGIAWCQEGIKAVLGDLTRKEISQISFQQFVGIIKAATRKVAIIKIVEYLNNLSWLEELTKKGMYVSSERYIQIKSTGQTFGQLKKDIVEALTPLYPEITGLCVIEITHDPVLFDSPSYLGECKDNMICPIMDNLIVHIRDKEVDLTLSLDIE